MVARHLMSAEVFDSERDDDVLPGTATLSSRALPGFELPLREHFAVLGEEE